MLNNSGRTVAIYVNGQYVGNISANNEGSFFVGAGPDEITEILARSGKYKWPGTGPRAVDRNVKNYTWTLNPIPE